MIFRNTLLYYATFTGTAAKLDIIRPYGFQDLPVNQQLPYGISSARKIFQKLIYDILLGASDVIAYFDDILVFRKSLDKHNSNLEIVLSKSPKVAFKS